MSGRHLQRLAAEVNDFMSKRSPATRQDVFSKVFRKHEVDVGPVLTHDVDVKEQILTNFSAVMPDRDNKKRRHSADEEAFKRACLAAVVGDDIVDPRRLGVSSTAAKILNTDPRALKRVRTLFTEESRGKLPVAAVKISKARKKFLDNEEYLNAFTAFMEDTNNTTPSTGKDDVFKTTLGGVKYSHQWHYMCHRPAELHQRFRDELQKLNAGRVDTAKMKIPSFRTFQRHLASLRWLKQRTVFHPRHVCACSVHEGAKLMYEAYVRMMKTTHGPECDCQCAKCRPNAEDACQALVAIPTLVQFIALSLTNSQGSACK